MKRLIAYGSIILLCLSAIVLIALQIHPGGWILLLIGCLTLPFCQKPFAKDLLLLYLSIAILGLTPISTAISNAHILFMGSMLLLAVLLPYFISRFIYKDYHVRFTFHHGRNWYKTEIFYIFFAAAVSYVSLPFVLQTTGSYHNWTVEPGIRNLVVLFIAIQGLGTWDEIFFTGTIIGILQRYFPYKEANLFHACIMSAFLYALGFRGWAFLTTFSFSFLQGYIFKKTKSLFYIITIHLTIDVVLYLAIIHAYHPTWMPIFFT